MRPAVLDPIAAWLPPSLVLQTARGPEALRVYHGWLGDQHRPWWPAEEKEEPRLHGPCRGGGNALFITWDWREVRWSAHLPGFGAGHDFLGAHGAVEILPAFTPEEEAKLPRRLQHHPRDPDLQAHLEARAEAITVARWDAALALVHILERYPDGRCPHCEGGVRRSWSACARDRGAVFQPGNGVEYMVRDPTEAPAPSTIPAIEAWLPEWVRQLPEVLPVSAPEWVEVDGETRLRVRWLRGSSAQRPDQFPAWEVVQAGPGSRAYTEGARWFHSSNTATVASTGSGGSGGPSRTFLEAVTVAAEGLLLRGSNLGNRWRAEKEQE